MKKKKWLQDRLKKFVQQGSPKQRLYFFCLVLGYRSSYKKTNLFLMALTLNISLRQEEFGFLISISFSRESMASVVSFINFSVSFTLKYSMQIITISCAYTSIIIHNLFNFLCKFILQLALNKNHAQLVITCAHIFFLRYI